MELSLIIPAHDESGRIGPTLRRYSEALRARYGERFEIVVVANGCSDDTALVAQRQALTLPQLRVIEIREPIGKGGAVLVGFRQARGRHVLFTDADASTDPASLLALAARLERYDIAIGSRRLPTSSIVRHQPLSRRIFGRVFSHAVRLCFALPYRDTQCGAKALRRDAAQMLAHTVREARWTFDIDLLLSAHDLGLRDSRGNSCPESSRLAVVGARVPGGGRVRWN